MDLEDQISKARQVIHTDAYPMSIGEMINIYKDGEIDIHPEFQRQYRWKEYQKSNLIESILLGIPLPSIFVAQREDGVWDVVDGLQRLSTILSFVGELKDEDERILPPLILEKTPYLSELKGASWTGETPNSFAISDDLKRAFKREKIDVKIIKKESDENAKFELFQRLNTGGSDLSEQEVRNCLLIMLKRDAYVWLKKASELAEFQGCIALSERLKDEKYTMELALRFVIATKFDSESEVNESDIGPYITNQMKKLVQADHFNSSEALFKKTFLTLNKELGDNAFKRYSPSKERYEGQFSVSLFEYISTGVAFALGNDMTDEEVAKKIHGNSKSIVDDAEFVDATKHGSRGINRFPKLIELARKHFS